MNRMCLNRLESETFIVHLNTLFGSYNRYTRNYNLLKKFKFQDKQMLIDVILVLKLYFHKYKNLQRNGTYKYINKLIIYNNIQRGFSFLCPHFKIPILPFKYNNLLNF